MRGARRTPQVFPSRRRCCRGVPNCGKGGVGVRWAGVGWGGRGKESLGPGGVAGVEGPGWGAARPGGPGGGGSLVPGGGPWRWVRWSAEVRVG